jgi:hypothetical protein
MAPYSARNIAQQHSGPRPGGRGASHWVEEAVSSAQEDRRHSWGHQFYSATSRAMTLGSGLPNEDRVGSRVAATVIARQTAKVSTNVA